MLDLPSVGLRFSVFFSIYILHPCMAQTPAFSMLFSTFIERPPLAFSQIITNHFIVVAFIYLKHLAVLSH